MSKNREIAKIFENMADMLSIADENPFRYVLGKKAP
ncbi:MAG: helix-hairpin-helix domain-containing protein [Thermodesulfobacteriota bacterium]